MVTPSVNDDCYECIIFLGLIYDNVGHFGRKCLRQFEEQKRVATNRTQRFASRSRTRESHVQMPLVNRFRF